MELLLLCLLALQSDDKMDLVAMVLRTGKEATVQRGKSDAEPVREMDLLAEGDQLTGGKDGVTIVLLSDGHSERLPAGKSARLSKTGCTPAGVSTVLKRKLNMSESSLKNLRDLALNSRGGVSVIRRLVPETPPPGHHPLHTSCVMTDRPSFSWPAVKGAEKYELEIFSAKKDGERERIWKATTVHTPTRINYPAKADSLDGGKTYHWQVTALLKDGERMTTINDAQFTVLKANVRKMLQALKPLEEGDDPDGWLVAAGFFEEYGVFEKAVPLYEKIVQKQPDQGNIYRALATCYKRLGLKDKAAAANKEAAKRDADK